MQNLFFQIKNGLITYGGQHIYENEQFIIVYEGEMSIQNNRIASESIIEYLISGGNFSGIDGLYSFIAYHKKSQKIFSTQDIISYYHPMYFCKTEHGFSISLSMKELIVKMGLTPQMEEKHIPEFLYNGFLTDDRCLLQGIKKIPVMHVLIYSCITGEIVYKKKHYSINTLSLESIDYISLLEDAIKSEIKDNYEINMALSSGFDSNLLLHIITSLNPKCKINAYCIGSIEGEDETESVKTIAGFYPQVNLLIYKVTSEMLNDFPQMVYELEDSVFERGIFLQYKMGEAMASKNSFPTFFGEGADQLLSSQFRMSADPYYFVGEDQHFPWVYFPYEMLTYIIIKKNGIFLRNRDIHAKYPFIKNNFINGVNTFRSRNGTNKEHYKQFVLSRVDPRVAEKLHKYPGTTNLTSLFCDANKNLLFKSARSCRFFNMMTKQPDRGSGSEVDMDSCLKILYLKCFETIFCYNYEMLDNEKCWIEFKNII